MGVARADRQSGDYMGRNAVSGTAAPSLAEALAHRAATTPSNAPKIEKALAELDDNERALLLEALRSDMPHRAIARALSDVGYPMSEKAVSSWREANL